MVGIATAFMDSPHSTAAKSSSSDSIKTIVVAGNIFLVHRQSLGALFDSIGSEISKPTKLDALASVSFEDDVELLLSHGW